MVKAASDANHVPYSVSLNYWRKRFSVTLQTYNVRIITQAYLALFDNGGGNLERDFSTVRAFEMLSAQLNLVLLLVTIYKTSICHVSTMFCLY